MSNALAKISLANTGRTTTQLGFGGSGLMGGISEKESLRLLEAAYDAGIRHFDVAPSYGHGAAERCLGKFLRGKYGQVTVTTKYGIEPPSHAGALDFARTFLRPGIRFAGKHMPSLRQRAASAAAGLKGRANFSVVQATASLERSRRDLGLEHIDLWLLHEATAADLAGNELLDFLQEQVRLGHIGTFGVGGDVSHLPELWLRHAGYCGVLQFDWPGFINDDSTAYPGAFLIHHRLVQTSQNLATRITRDPAISNRLALGDGPIDHGQVAALLINAALFAYPKRMLLFSSRSPEHILANIRAAGDTKGPQRAEALREIFLSSQPGFTES